MDWQEMTLAYFSPDPEKSHRAVVEEVCERLAPHGWRLLCYGHAQEGAVGTVIGAGDLIAMFVR